METKSKGKTTPQQWAHDIEQLLSSFRVKRIHTHGEFTRFLFEFYSPWMKKEDEN